MCCAAACRMVYRFYALTLEHLQLIEQNKKLQKQVAALSSIAAGAPESSATTAAPKPAAEKKTD